MNALHITLRAACAGLFGLALALSAGTASAAATSISTVPILNIDGTGTVKPNLMLLYDNSGSMAYNYTPDLIVDNTTCRAGTSMASGTTSCIVGHPPFNSPDFNRQYYNPKVQFLPPVKADLSSYPSQTRDLTSGWTNVANDTYGKDTKDLRNESTGTTNLATGFPDLKWCNGTRATASCNFNTATYSYPTDSRNVAQEFETNAYYYNINVGEYCSDANLTNCRTVAVNSGPTGAFTFPAKVRWCNSSALSTCQAKYSSTYKYPRFSATSSGAVVTGTQIFERVDIVASRASYPKDAARLDCVGTTCTYDEEMTNFANWYTYYKTRNQMMKSAVGQAFAPLNENYNVGIAALSAAAAGNAVTRPRLFTGTDRANWYTTLYGYAVSGGTPLRAALNNIGNLYANKSPYVQTVGDEVVKYPCQQNFTFMTTDGYWNGDPSPNVTSNDQVQNLDRFCSAAEGCVDPTAQSTNSLADVALYWYNGGTNGTTISLRPTLDAMTVAGQVPAAAGENRHLHMRTYTLGLGVDGIMNYEKNYDTAPIPGGDFSKLINGVTTGCPWNGGGRYVWPDVKLSNTGNTVQERVDDLWHAAVNGHGKYVSASDPTQVVSGLRSALSNIAAKVGAAAAAATSNPNVSANDNDVFSSTFTTVKWNGKLIAQKLNISTGAVVPTVLWDTSYTIGKLVANETDTRVIKMLDPVTRTLKDFTYASMTATEKAWFDTKCSVLSQCINLSPENRVIINRGATIVNWLRGQQKYADDVMLRAYTQSDLPPPSMTTTVPVVLGDIASSKPAYVRDPRKSYVNTGYSTFKADNALRAATVYIAANDGMLHAFDAVTGVERWAYVPRITMKKLHLQASTTYGISHQYTTDGSPEVSDVQIGGVWKTVLVAGMNAGGRGYYALDVTNPAAPVALWETCADATICTGDNNEAELGLTFGNPQMGTWTDASGDTKWVAFVASGYNNVSGSDGVTGGGGEGWLMILDIATGKVLSKVSTGSGTPATPSGFTRITGITANPATDPQMTYVYGGDNLGQMWRFDLTTRGAPTVTRMGNAGPLQPITTRPDVTMCSVTSTAADATVSTSNKIVVAFGTGRLLDLSDVSNTDTQGVYVVKDTATSIGTAMTPTDWRATLDRQVMLKTVVGANTYYTVSGPEVKLATRGGWYTQFTNPGERINLDMKIVTGGLYAVTNVPSSASACTVGGRSIAYSFDVCNAKGDMDFANPSTAALPSGSTYGGKVGEELAGNGAVGFVIISLPNGIKKIIVTKANGDLETLPAGDPKTPVSRRAGWRRIMN